MCLMKKRNQLDKFNASAFCGDCKSYERFVSSQVNGHWFHTCLNCGRNYKDGVAQVFKQKGMNTRVNSIKSSQEIKE